MLGPYEIVHLLGAGGMGEVYCASDARIGRSVALKVLPSSFAGDSVRIRRFEQEMRAAGMVNHPNVVVVHDVGIQDGTPFLVSELLEGRTLRELLMIGLLEPRRAMTFIEQIAAGLAAAHDKGITHRDLKPENLFVTTEDRVKILDFGLARLMDVTAPQGVTVPRLTDSGTILGTAAYMSPEQIRGEAVDARSDIFSLGIVIFEILAARHPFDRPTRADTMAAILTDEAPSLAGTVPELLGRVVARCLAKDPLRRFQSVRDLSFAIDLAATSVSSSTSSVAPGILNLQRITFRRGTIESARFAPDGQGVVYGAAWNGQPTDVYLALPGGTESRRLGFERTEILAVARNGEMALSLDRRRVSTLESVGIMARASLSGGGARELLDGVALADWMPNHDDLVVVCRDGGKERLEMPVGNVVLETPGRIGAARVSPNGETVAVVEHPTQVYSRGSIAVVDARGNKRTLTREWSRVEGLAWSPTGDEIWFTASDGALAKALYGVTLAGTERLISGVPGSLRLHDIARDGRLLVGHETVRREMRGLFGGDLEERDLSWLDYSAPKGFSSDGSTLLFHETGDGGGPDYGVYVRRADRSLPVRLGTGRALALSPDARFALVLADAERDLMLVPTGVGRARKINCGELRHHGLAAFFSDGRLIAFIAEEKDRATRCYVVDTTGGKPVAISPEGTTFVMGEAPVSPSGTIVTTSDPDGTLTAYPVDGGKPQPIAGALKFERILAWSNDGESIWLRRPNDVPATVVKLHIRSGERVTWNQFVPGDIAGVAAVDIVLIAPDAKSWVYSFIRTLSDLYVSGEPPVASSRRSSHSSPRYL